MNKLKGFQKFFSKIKSHFNSILFITFLHHSYISHLILVANCFDNVTYFWRVASNYNAALKCYNFIQLAVSKTFKIILEVLVNVKLGGVMSGRHCLWGSIVLLLGEYIYSTPFKLVTCLPCAGQVFFSPLML